MIRGTMNVAEYLMSRGSDEAAALIEGGRITSYAALRSGAGSVAVWIGQEALEPGSRIGTLSENAAFFVKAYLGIIHAGMVAVPLNSDGSPEGAVQVLRAAGASQVLGLLMPERDSSPETLPLSQTLARHIGIEAALEDITGILYAAGCYRRRDAAIKLVIPEYGQDWKSKIVLPSVLDGDQYRLFSIVAQSPAGERIEARLTPEAYLGIVAATNFKQRTRKMLEYYHADRLNYAVAGTPNLLEYDQGFFVKLGDGAADIKPIAHLYKTQVYAMARHLGLPEAICCRLPTTDTYSLPQSQEEFYFSLSYDKMDLVLYGKNHGYSAAEIAPAVGLTAEKVERVCLDIEGKRRVASYLHSPPVLVEETVPTKDRCS